MYDTMSGGALLSCLVFLFLLLESIHWLEFPFRSFHTAWPIFLLLLVSSSFYLSNLTSASLHSFWITAGIAERHHSFGNRVLLERDGEKVIKSDKHLFFGVVIFFLVDITSSWKNGQCARLQRSTLRLFWKQRIHL